MSAAHYRRPEQLPLGGVLVVGASATGLQLAREIHASGRPVTIAVGEHVRLPRLYRGRDWWMPEAGWLRQRIDDEEDPRHACRLPSSQLIGTPERETIDLHTLRIEGIEAVGRLAALRDDKTLFSGSLRNVCALADLKMERLLDGIDAFARERGLDSEIGSVERFAPTLPTAAPRLTMNLAQALRTVIWATGYRPKLSWLRMPGFDADGALTHDRGVFVGTPSLYALGLPFVRRRQSSFIHGCMDVVAEIGSHLFEGLRASAWPSECKIPRLTDVRAGGPA